MSDLTHDLLIHGVAAAKAKDNQEARFYLERMLNLSPDPEEELEAMYWLSVISTDIQEARGWIEEVLARNLGDARARRRLAILDGKIKVEEEINPDQYHQKRVSFIQTANGDRYTCSRCGGKMVFAPDGNSLICEFCDFQEEMGRQNGLESDNFIAAMATARGHSLPISIRTFACMGCGARYSLPPQTITLTCPYCQSSHFVDHIEETEIICPQSIILFKITENEAKSALLSYFREAGYQKYPRVAPAMGIYLPVWIFEIGGQISWTYYVQKKKDEWIKVTDQAVIYQTNLHIPASSKSKQILSEIIRQYEVRALEAFDEKYLASWAAETYDISLGDASLKAREIALDLEKKRVRANLFEPVNNLVVDSSNMIVENFQLGLFPVWLTYYQENQQNFSVVINGQTGQVTCSRSREDREIEIQESSL